MGGRVGGWSEEWRVMLNSTQVQIKLKLKFELSLAIFNLDELRFNLDELRCNLDLTLGVVSTFTGGWVGGQKIGG